MTQLIAALCDKGKAAVAVSDRMVTTTDMTLGFEPPSPKAEVVSAKCMVLIAGTVHEPDLVRDGKQKARGKDRFRDIADVFKSVYQELRERRVEDHILRARLGIPTFDEFHKKQQMLIEGVVADTYDRIARYDLGLHLLLVGVDEQAHIAVVANPGQWRSFDNLGWSVVGMGDRHAESVFAWYRYSQVVTVNEALYIAYEAKKKSEMAGGIGPNTDMFVIKPEGIYDVGQKTAEVLQEVYHDRESGGKGRPFDKTITDLKPELTKVEAS